MSNNDYLAGPHHFWTHFWCGLVVGAGLGAWLGWGNFASGWRPVAVMVVVALALAYMSGRWGDAFWHGLIEWFRFW